MMETLYDWHKSIINAFPTIKQRFKVGTGMPVVLESWLGHSCKLATLMLHTKMQFAR